MKAALGAALLADTAGAAAPGAEADPETARMRQVLTDYAEAWRGGDTARIAALYHDDFTLFYPGRHPLAGVHRGKPEALRVLGQVTQRTNRQLLEVLAVMAGPRRGALNVAERWSRDGQTAVVERVLVYTLKDGRLFECRLFDADQETVARFLA